MSLTYPRSKTTVDRRAYHYSYEYYTPGLHRGDGSVTVNCDGVVSLGKSPEGWRHNIAAGTPAGSPMLGTERKVRAPFLQISKIGLPGTPAFGFDEYASGFMGYLVNPPAPLTGVDPFADNLARENLLGSYIKATKVWRGGNFLAEVTETIHMLRHPTTQLYDTTMRFVRNVRGIKALWLHYPSEYARRLSGYWLGWQFGVSPLLADVRDANRALEKLRERGTAHDVLRIKGTGRRTQDMGFSSRQPVTATPVSSVLASFDTNTIRRWQVKYYGAICARPENIGSVQDTFGVEGSDILPAVWEAVPWSFLVDYFVNVQTMLDSMRYASAELGWLMQGAKNDNSKYVSASILRSPTPNTAEMWYRDSSKQSAGYAKTIWKQRSVLGSMPYPSFRFKMPGLDSTKWWNIAALVTQIAASKPNRGIGIPR